MSERPVEERIDHEPQIALKEHELLLIEGSVTDMAAGRAVMKRVNELNRAYLALLTEHSALAKAAQAHHEHTRDYCSEELDHDCPTWTRLGRCLPAREPKEDPCQ